MRHEHGRLIKPDRAAGADLIEDDGKDNAADLGGQNKEKVQAQRVFCNTPCILGGE